MKTTITIRERIGVRAYYAWLAGSAASDEANWLAAEQIELALAERRAASAKRAAETRKARTVPTAPAEMLVATTKRPTLRRLTAH